MDVPKILDRLRRDELRFVFRKLVARHPELREEAAALAEDVLREVDPEAVAADLQATLRALDLGQLSGRAGQTPLGYVEPTEAAWEILQEAVEPFLDNVRRCVELGLDEAAVAACSGIVLGLYRADDAQEGELLQHAPDFPAEAAHEAAELLAGRKRKRRLPNELLSRVPDWAAGLEGITG